jgi:PAS domain S-box-containing protein
VRAASIVALYVVGWLGLKGAANAFEIGPGMNLWSPPPALNLALVQVFGAAYIPAIPIGQLMSAFWLDPLPISPMYIWVFGMIQMVVYGAAGVVLRRRLSSGLWLRSVRDIVWFVGVGGVGAPLMVALLGAADFAAAGLFPWSDYPEHVLKFWAGDSVGVLVLAPFLLIHVVPRLSAAVRERRLAALAEDLPPHTLRRRARSAAPRLLAQAASLALAPWVLVGLGSFEVFCFLPLIWVALSYGLPGAVIAVLALNVETMLAIWLWDMTPANLVNYQLLMIAMALTGLFVGAIVGARQRAEEALRRQKEYMEALHDTALALVNRLDLDGLLETIVARAGALVGAVDGFVYLVDETEDAVILRVGVGIFSNRIGTRLGRGQGLAGNVWRAGQPLVLEDYNTWPGSDPLLRWRGFHALAGVPLTSGGQVVGVIGLAYREAGQRFSVEAIGVLRRFAQLASLALDNARLYSAAQQELVERERALEALRETQRNLRLIAENTGDVVFAYDMERRLLYCNAAFESLTGYTLAELYEQDFINYLYPDDEARMLALFESTFRGESFMNAEYRIVTRGGTVRWCSSSVGPLLDEHAVQIGVQGLERDISERKRAEETQHFLAEGSVLLGASLDYETTLKTLTQLVVPYLADWCIVHTLRPDGAIQRTADAFADPQKEAMARLIRSEYPIDPTAPHGYPRALRTGQPELIAEVSDEILAASARDERHLQLQREMGIRSTITVPLIARGRTLGAITLVCAESERRYDDSDLDLVKDLAHRAALAVDNAQLYRAAQRRLAELTTLQNVAWAINSTLGLDEMFRTVVTQISAAFGYQMVSIYLREGDGLALQSYVGYDEVMWFIRLDQAVSGRVARTGQAVFVRDAAADPDFIVVAPGTRQAIIVPLKRGESKVLGILLVESTGEPILTEDDFALLLLLADQISVAVANSRLFAEQRTSEQRYRSLLEQAADSIFVTEPDGRILDANEQATALLGYARGELLSMRLHDLVAPAEVSEAADALMRLRQATRATASLHLRRRDGAFLPVEISAAAIDAGVVLAIVRDVSERLRLESQLRQAQKLEAIGTLANGIAHDFNNLLAAITGYADLALDSTAPDDPRHADLQQIMRAAQRGAGLTRQLLAFSRPAVPERHPLSPADLVQEAFRLLRPTIPSTIAIRVAPAGDGWMVDADAAQIQQVLVNLVVNARDALPDGGSIEITTTNVLLDVAQARRMDVAPGRYVRLSVADNGIGMDEQTVGRIFEPFFTTKAHGKGTGLGLAITHGIVRSHGGVIDVSSRPGEGTTMAIYLPASGAAAHPAETDGASAPRGQGELILVVDDEPAVRRLGQRILERYSYRTLAAEDGRSAVEVFRAHAAEVAAVVLDLTMPEMDGRATFYALREISDVPIVFSSGQSAAELAAQLTAPDTLFIAKPYNLAELTRAVAQVLQLARKIV